MNGMEVGSTVREELEHIPAGEAGSPQRMLRALYDLMRRASLAKDPNQPRADAFAESVAALRNTYPYFEPKLTDPRYFGWNE